MAYIGREPQIGNFQVCDAISVVNGQAAYTMQVSSVNVSPETENHMLVSLNGILQRPGSSFTVSGSTITFASNLVTGDVINFIHILGSVLDLGVPSDSTVSLAKLTATGTKDATTFLRGDNTFAEAGIRVGTTTNTTSGTSIDFTSLPSGINRFTLLFNQVSTSGTSYKLIRVGKASGFVSSGYQSASSIIYGSNSTEVASSTAGFLIRSDVASEVFSGSASFHLLDNTNDIWTYSSVLGTATRTWHSAGYCSLGGELTQVRLTTVNGSDTFDNGSINIFYE